MVFINKQDKHGLQTNFRILENANLFPKYFNKITTYFHILLYQDRGRIYYTDRTIMHIAGSAHRVPFIRKKPH